MTTPYIEILRKKSNSLPRGRAERTSESAIERSKLLNPAPTPRNSLDGNTPPQKQKLSQSSQPQTYHEKAERPIESFFDIEKIFKLQYDFSWLFKSRVNYANQSEAAWLSDFQTIYEFNTIAKFWGMFNNIPHWRDLTSGSIYALFKRGIKPSWEDKKNKGGFSWAIYISKSTSDKDIKALYLDIVLMIIGNTYDYSELLNGCTFERKQKGDKIVFWFRTPKISEEDNIKEGFSVKPRKLFTMLLDLIEVKPHECGILSNDDKIDWKAPKLKGKKYAIKMIPHDTTAQKKAN